MSNRTRRYLVTLGVVLFLSAFVGLAYPSLFGPEVQPPWIYTYSMTISFFLPLFGVTFELLYVGSERGAWLRRLPFGGFIAVKFLAYLVVIDFSIALTTWLIVPGVNTPYEVHVAMGEFVSVKDVAISMLIFTTFVLGISLNQLLGPGVLGNFLTGRYHHPRRERRVFLFMDMVGSTAAAERLGEVSYHSLLNIFFTDIAEPIMEHGGVVHRYVGDEMIVSWPLKRGVPDVRCLEAVAAAHMRLEKRRLTYQERFGFEPRFRAALHVGDVVTGEIGEHAREIVFVGDAANTTSRIRETLVSGELISAIDLPDHLEVEDLGPVPLRGREEPVRLFALINDSAKAAMTSSDQRAGLSIVE